MHRREIERKAVECLLALESRGVEVKILSGDDEVRAALRQFKRSTGVAHNPDRLLLTPGNTFWVFTYQHGEPLVAFGVRVDDLGGEDAHDFLRRSIQVIFGVNVLGAQSQIFKGRKWGRAAYFGALLSTPVKGLGRERKQIIQLVTAYAHHCAFVDLGADVNYCFLRGSHGSRALTYGFLDADPFVWSTDEPMYSDGNPEWVMHLSRDRLPALFTSTSALLRSWLTENQKALGPIEVDNAAD